MFGRATVCFVLSRMMPRIPLANQHRYAFPTITSYSRIRMPVREITSGNGFGWSISGLPAARALKSLEVNPGDHHLIVIYYYKQSSVYKLDVAIPKEKYVSEHICDNKIFIKCDGGCLAEFLEEKLKKMSKGRERKLCLKIAELCGGKIRSLHPITNPYNRESLIAEVEVGTLKDWAEHRKRPYLGERVILKEDLGDNVIVRLCKGNMGGPIYEGPSLSFTDFV